MKTQLASAQTVGARLRLRITARAESLVRDGHPWIFSERIQAQNRRGELGELGAVYDRKDRFLAIGLFDPNSPIRLRVLHAGKPVPIDDAWWVARLKAAVDRRRALCDPKTTGFRLVNGESDGWPGLVLDRYDRTFVMKLYTAAWLPRLEEIARLFQREIKLERLVLRLSRNIQKLALDRFSRHDGTVLFGAPLEGPILFSENGLLFEADVLKGQKTGFFLDQRENRRRVGAMARGRDVLNAFSFSGGFSLYAARGGARSVTDLDLSAYALSAAERNFALNITDPAIGSCPHESVQADVFEWLAGDKERNFGLIILDPPSLAKRASEKAGAIRAYGKLVTLALNHLSPGGLLVACSCSAHVTAEEFFAAVRNAASSSGRKCEEMQTTFHAADHPATFKEAEYLKGIYLKALDQTSGSRVRFRCSPPAFSARVRRAQA